MLRPTDPLSHGSQARIRKGEGTQAQEAEAGRKREERMQCDRRRRDSQQATRTPDLQKTGTTQREIQMAAEHESEKVGGNSGTELCHVRSNSKPHTPKAPPWSLVPKNLNSTLTSWSFPETLAPEDAWSWLEGRFTVGSTQTESHDHEQGATLDPEAQV